MEQLTFQETGGGIFEAVGDSIIDLGGVKTQEGAAAAKGREEEDEEEEETPLNFLVLFFKSDKWLAKMSGVLLLFLQSFCHAIFIMAADSNFGNTQSILCEEER